LGAVVVEQLVNWQLVRDFADLYTLDVPTLAKLDRLAEKSASNLVQAIDDSRQGGLTRLLFGLGIRHAGERVAAILAAQYGSIDALAQASADELAAINDIGPVIAESVYQFFAHEENHRTIERLREAGVCMDEPSPPGAGPAAHSMLAGKVFVLTGALPNMTRDEARGRITAAGGRVTSSVSRKTDYVVAGADPGNKHDKAQRLGVSLIDEEELYRLLQAKT
ncbi:MAG: helix-hairpin-helix domain-containing protein, partial [bacterium]|nr:helix-hairpin-helix domain-containing protein [bacterium]